MTEPTDALLPCPFCGASASGYEIEPHTHSGPLKKLGVPDHQGGYVIEGNCACGSGLIGATQAEVTERWNRRTASPAVAGEPVACALDQQGFFDKFQAEYFTEHGYVSTGDRTLHDQFKHARAWAWNSYQQGLAATPQPTQAQAGAVPMHASVVKRIWDECRAQGLDYVAFAWRIQRATIEAAHGIKGGQHAE